MSALKKVVCRKPILTGNAGKYCHLNGAGTFFWKKSGREGLAEKLVTPELLSLQQELSKAAVTVLKDSSSLVPLDLSVSGTVLLSVSPSLSEAYPFYHQLKQTFPVGWLHANVDSLDAVEARLRPTQRVLVAHTDKGGTVCSFAGKAVQRQKPLALICFGDMKMLEKIPEVVRRASTVYWHILMRSLCSVMWADLF